MLDNNKVREWLTDTDGYSVMAPSFFLEMGFEKDLIDRMSYTHSSDPDLGKHAVTRNDGTSGDVVGVAEFAMVDVVAKILGVEPCHTYFGRGTNFRYTVGRVLEALAE